MNPQSQSSTIPTARPPPPSIPPLSFGDNSLSRDRPSGSGSSQQQESSRTPNASTLASDILYSLGRSRTISSPSSANADPSMSRPGGPRNPTIQPTRVLPRSFASARAASQLSNNNESNAARGGSSSGRADLHSFMSRHARMESTRVDDAGESSSAFPLARFGRDALPGPTRRPIPGQRPASTYVEPIRPDGRNTSRQAQFIEHFRREHGMASQQSAASHDSEGSSNGDQPHLHSRRILTRNSTVFGMDFGEGGELTELDGRRRIFRTENPAQRRRHVHMDLSEDETKQKDTSTPAITTASRRRLLRMQAPEMMMFSRGFRGGRALGDFMVCILSPWYASPVIDLIFPSA